MSSKRPRSANSLKPAAIRELPVENSRPFWSVMIPTYNPQVIDDASPNGAPTEFISKLAGKRVTVHCEPCNLGLSGIWNRCIRTVVETALF
jgi:hypothetical protein